MLNVCGLPEGTKAVSEVGAWLKKMAYYCGGIGFCG